MLEHGEALIGAVHSYTADWNWDLVWRGAQVAVSVLGFIAVVWTIRLNTKAHIQKVLADNRAEWWQRFIWAVDKTQDPSTLLREMGWNALEELSGSALLTPTELYWVRSGTQVLHPRPVLWLPIDGQWTPCSVEKYDGHSSKRKEPDHGVSAVTQVRTLIRPYPNKHRRSH
ncbi:MULTISPECIES: hypothetical protein [unclassified Corynebacterium]|uniref:hypothetical protein n=1 Tax=unclassified Corynebacterium TaxID=2624378 RepID=UPI0029CA163F|nr:MULTISPECIES: hypothetical protein [unclassified Corynebacterium]WPF65342.1 hypothetical protein OLX12_07070 [Corynebacterium sp. 22KM0430]WPF67837.1 hypothetical protein OLW90_07060 [Corynebacterium sp. 21KM1197]